MGSKGRYCPFSASAWPISRTEVPARAVKVNSSGSYSTMPRRARVESSVTSAGAWERRGLVRAPTASTRGWERTASASAAGVAGVRGVVMRRLGSAGESPIPQTRRDSSVRSDMLIATRPREVFLKLR